MIHPQIAPRFSRFRSLLLSIVYRYGLCALVMPAVMPSSPVAAQPADNMPKVLRTGFLQRVFYAVDSRDIKAALDVQTRQISRSLGLSLDSRVVMYADMASMINALRCRELEMVTMPTIEYLRIRHRIPLIPSFVSACNNGQGSRYVVIAHTESGIRSFSGLKGKSILLPPVARHDTGHLWLETLVMKTGKRESEGFFGQVRESPKVSHAIMAVFLRQTDAAIVTRSGLDASRQLNPQLDTKLTILAESRNLSDGVTCLIPATPETFRANLTKAVMQLNMTRSGQQLFTMFQSSGIALFKPAYLEGLEELFHEHSRLKSKTSKRK